MLNFKTSKKEFGLSRSPLKVNFKFLFLFYYYQSIVKCIGNKMPLDEYQMISIELIGWREKDNYIKWYRSNVKRIFLEHNNIVNQLKARTKNNLTKEQNDFISKLKTLEIKILKIVNEFALNNNHCGILLIELKNELDSYIKTPVLN